MQGYFPSRALVAFFCTPGAALYCGTASGVSAGKFVDKYSTKASRSCFSTSAPHFVILSTSLPHALLSRRYCTIIPESWHSIHAVFTLGCIGPGGRSGAGPCACTNRRADVATHNMSTTLSFDMEFHPLDSVPQIAARIPDALVRLYTPCTIAGASHYGVLSCLCGLPRVLP